MSQKTAPILIFYNLKKLE